MLAHAFVHAHDQINNLASRIVSRFEANGMSSEFAGNAISMMADVADQKVSDKYSK